MKKYYFAGWLTLIMSFLAIQTNAQSCDVEFEFNIDNGVLYANAFGPGETSTILWNVNGVTVGQGLNLVYTLCETGDYEICLLVSGPDCEDTYCETFFSPGLCENCPTAMEYTTPGCQEFLFQLFPGNPQSTVFWDFGDGETYFGVGNSAEHIYDEPGTYQVLAAYSGPDCPNGSEVLLTILVEACDPCPTYLYNEWISCDSLYFFLGDISADSIFWEFGDGQVETTYEYSTAHVFDLDSYYEVCAYVMGGPCDGQEICTGVDAYCYDECDAFFSIYEFGPGQYELYPFYTNLNVEMAWYVDGQFYGEDEFMTLVLTEPGYHSVCLYVAGPDCEDEYCIDLYVEPFDCVAEIGISEEDPFYYTFNPVFMCDPFLSYSWSIDGIYYSSECVFSVPITESGWHTVCLEVEGNNCFDQTCTEFYVPLLGCPTAIYAEEGVECGDFYFELYEIFDPNIIVEWNIDGAIFDNGIAIETTLAEGTHTICAIIVQGAEECLDQTICVTVEVPPCEIECESSFEVIYTDIPGYVEFENTSTWSGSPIFCWYVNDSFSGLAEDFNYQFTSNGTYEICLQVITEYCEDWYCFTVVIDDFDESCPSNITYTYMDCNSAYMFLDTEEWVFWDFGDGNTEWASGPVEHSFGWAGNFEVCAWMIGDDCPNGVEVCTSISISEECFIDCEASFEVDAIEGNPGSYNFPNTSTLSGGTPIYCWYINDELIVISEEFSYTFAEAGTYEVCLLLTTGDCESWFCETIVVDQGCEPCSVEVETTNYGGCLYGFSASVPYGDADVTWIISNGVTMTGAETSYVFNDPGVYTICAMATSDSCPDGASECFVLEVECNFECNAAFDYNIDNSGWVEFYNNSSWNTEASFYWDFGDGTGSNSFDESHYFAPGEYTVCLYIENQYCSDVICNTIFVPGNECPQEIVCDPIDCGFYSFWVPGFENTELFWDFGNGISYWSTGFIEMEFEPGTYDVCVMTEDCEICQFLVVEPCDFQCPTEFSCDPLECGWSDFWIPGYENETVFWNFGDGSSEQTGGLIEHYFEPGTYVVCAYIEGCETICQEVIIEDCYSCDVFATYTYVEGCGIMFTASASAPDAVIWWDFGDGSDQVEGFNPIHTYPENGVYTVSLNMWSAQNDCDTDLTLVVDVYCNECYDEIVVTEYDCPEFNFWIPGANDYEIFWDFGDGTYDANVNSIDHTFPGNGEYIVCAEYYSDQCNNWNYICETVIVTGCDVNCEVEMTWEYVDGVLIVYAESNIPDAELVWSGPDGPLYGNPVYFEVPFENSNYDFCVEAWNGECDAYDCEVIWVEETECYADFDVVVLDDQTVQIFNNSTFNDNSSYVWTLNGEVIWDTYNLYLDFLPADDYVLCLDIYDNDGQLSCSSCEDFQVGEDTGCAQMNLWVEALQMWDAEGTVEYEIFQDDDFVLGGGWDLSDQEYFASDSFCLEDGCYSATFYASGELIEYLFFINLYASDESLELINQTIDWENGTVTIEFGVNSDCSTQIIEVAADLFSMYPNPAQNQVQLSIPVGANVNVYDLIGNLVYETKSNSELTTLDVSNFSGGLYLVTVRHEGKALTQRLEVMH